MIRSALRRLVAPSAARVVAVALVGGALAGCTAVGGVSDAGAMMGDAGAALTGRERMAPLTVKPPTDRVTMQFLPFTGLPVNTADSIYRRIRTVGPEHGINLVHRLEEPATYRVRGHFVALGNETSTTVIFTWDIYDASGNNVYKIVGQEVAQSGTGDAWAGVGGEAQDRLAMRAVRALSAWLHGAKR
jgi:hypothetical protein